MYRRVDLWLVEAAESEAHPHPVGEMVETPVVLVADQMSSAVVMMETVVEREAAFVGHGHI